MPLTFSITTFNHRIGSSAAHSVTGGVANVLDTRSGGDLELVTGGKLPLDASLSIKRDGNFAVMLPISSVNDERYPGYVTTSTWTL